MDDVTDPVVTRCGHLVRHHRQQPQQQQQQHQQQLLLLLLLRQFAVPLAVLFNMPGVSVYSLSWNENED